MDKVAVLMSTYNGEQYLAEQIDSILSQKHVLVELIVRDDGSTDKTISILEKYQEEQKLTLIKGKNLGAAGSFIDLIFNSPKADFYAFSDQDDVWDYDKLHIAINHIREIDKPALYHGLAGRVDKNLKAIENPDYKPLQSFPASLLTSATGCTMVFNNSLMDKLRFYRPSIVSMHDAWVYRVAYAFDSYVFYDTESHMKYRQHENNVSGGVMTMEEKVRSQFVKNKGQRLTTAEELYKGFADQIPDKNRETLYKFINYKKLAYKMNIIFGKEFVANSAKTSLQFKILFLLNRI